MNELIEKLNGFLDAAAGVVQEREIAWQVHYRD